MEKEIIEWINRDVKLSKNIKNIKEDFKNGFLFKELMNKLQINFSQIFVNKDDDQCIYQNFFNVKEICAQKLGINLNLEKKVNKQFEILKAIKEKVLPGGKTVLKNLQGTNQSLNEDGYLQQFTQNLGTRDKHLAKSFQKNTLQDVQLPPKILKIETKLEKFREEKIKHEIMAKKLKDEEIALDNSIKQEIRQQEITKLKNNHQYIKDQSQRIYDNWSKTQQIKINRQQEDERFQLNMTNRIKKRVQDQKDFESNDFKEGLEYFRQNCQRLGVELKHDPNQQPKKDVEKAFFSIPALMYKIKERNQQSHLARKEKEKRKNRMQVENERQMKIVEQKKVENELMARFAQECDIYNTQCYENTIMQFKKEKITENMTIKSKNIEKERFEYFDKISEQNKKFEKENKEIRMKEFKKKQLEYKELNLQKKIKKRAKHNAVCGDIMKIILDMTEICYNKQREEGDIRIEQKFWDQLIARFAEGKKLTDEKVFKIFDQKDQLQRQNSKAMLQHDMLLDHEFSDYYSAVGCWRPLHYYENEDLQILNRPFNNNLLGDFLHCIVDTIHPKLKNKPRPEDIPDYMPLKISLIGPRFSGKKTVCNLLKQKYGLITIDVNEIMKEAVLLAFPPVEDEQTKKKNAKKDTKGIEEKKENPYLKSLGEKIQPYVTENQPVPNDLQVQAVVIKIKELFPLKTNQQIIDEVNQAAKAQEEKNNLILKQQEEKLKKQTKKADKKDAKKASKQEEVEEVQRTPEEMLQDKIIEPKPLDYTPGFVLYNFPVNYEQAKLLEEELTGWIPEQERLNEQGEQTIQKISDLVCPSEKQQDLTLRQGGLDFVFYMDIDNQESWRRGNGRKIDPQTDIIYHMEDNPPPNDTKLLERLKVLNPELTQEQVEDFNNKLLNECEILAEFYQRTGIEKIGLHTWQVQSGVGKGFEILTHTDEHIYQALEYKKTTYFEQMKSQIEEEQAIEQQKKQEESQQQKDNQENKEQDKNEEIQQQQQPQDVSVVQKSEIEELLNRIKTNQNNLNTQELEFLTNNFLGKLNSDQTGLLLKMWLETQDNYINDCKSTLFQLIKHREVVNSRCIEVQVNFLQIIQRKDDKISKILNFQENLNKFIEDNPQMLKFQNARDELNNHLDQLYEGLWDAIEAKKNEAIQERKSILSSGWIESEMDSIYSKYLRLFQLEMNRLNEVVDLFFFVKDTYCNFPQNEVKEHIILDPFQSSEPPIEQEGSFPKIEALYCYFIETVDNIDKKITEMREKFLKRRGFKQDSQDDINQDLIFSIDRVYDEIREYEKKNTKIRALILKNNCISRLQEVRLLGQALYNRLDDWIIFGIKRENSVSYDSVKHLRSAIEKQTLANVGPIQFKDISETYKVLNVFNQIPKLIQPMENTQNNKRFSIAQLKLLHDELVTITDQAGCVDITAFVNLLLRRITSKECSKFLPSFCLKINQQTLENVPENLNPDVQQLLNFKELMTALILFNSPVANQEHIEAYKEQLNEYNNQGYIEINDFINVPAYFDEFEADESLYDEYHIERPKFIKNMLFDLYSDMDQYLLNIDYFLEEIGKFASRGTPNFSTLVFGDLD